MLSYLASRATLSSPFTKHLTKYTSNKTNRFCVSHLQQIRWSGHNTMKIEPNNYYWRLSRDFTQLYSLIAFIPVITIATILGIKDNPELVDTPEGYEPRHWEYHKHILTRWIARYLLDPPEKDHEMEMAMLDGEYESALMNKIRSEVNKCMKFYNDYRGPVAFRPFYADYFRAGKFERKSEFETLLQMNSDIHADAYQNQSIPIEGYKEGDIDKFD